MMKEVNLVALILLIKLLKSISLIVVTLILKIMYSMINKYRTNIVLTKADTDLVIRLYVPEQLRKSEILKYHDYSGHMGIDKTYDAIKGKYYWPCM